MNISILVAAATNNAIGKNNKLLWRLSDDLKLFKKRTTGHAIIMGRKTFESIGKPLPNRTNIVISENRNMQIENCFVVHSMAEAIKLAKEKNLDKEIFVIGGAMIYELAMKYCNKIYLTLVKKDFEGDAFFDYQPFLKWHLISKKEFKHDENNEVDFEVWELEK